MNLLDTLDLDWAISLVARIGWFPGPVYLLVSYLSERVFVVLHRKAAMSDVDLRQAGWVFLEVVFGLGVILLAGALVGSFGGDLFEAVYFWGTSVIVKGADYLLLFLPSYVAVAFSVGNAFLGVRSGSSSAWGRVGGTISVVALALLMTVVASWSWALYGPDTPGYSTGSIALVTVPPFLFMMILPAYLLGWLLGTAAEKAARWYR